MANNPISMNKVRQILRLHTQGYKKLQIAEQTGVARNTLKKYLKEFTESGLNFSEVNELSDKDLEDLFVKPKEQSPINDKLKTLFDLFPMVDKEMKRKVEIIEDRHGKSSLIITSQVPVSKWHDVIGEKTVADAILDRIVHQAHRLDLKGESLRKKIAKLNVENSNNEN
jgi:predicted transcriptional regulator